MSPRPRPPVRARASSCLAFAFALGALFVLSPLARADCEPSHRVAHDRANCLDGGLGRSGGSKRLLWARNTCSDLGTVVAKWDVAHLSDFTWHLSGPHQRTEHHSVPFGVKGPYCCNDKGPCNRIDRSARPGPYGHDDAGCRTQWRRSGAAKRCDLVGAEYRRGASRWCRLTVRCDTAAHPGGARTESAYRSVRIQQVDELKWCPQRLPHRALVYHTEC